MNYLKTYEKYIAEESAGLNGLVSPNLPKEDVGKKEPKKDEEQETETEEETK